jgi:hypothetical protein
MRKPRRRPPILCFALLGLLGVATFMVTSSGILTFQVGGGAAAAAASAHSSATVQSDLAQARDRIADLESKLTAARDMPLPTRIGGGSPTPGSIARLSPPQTAALPRSSSSGSPKLTIAEYVAMLGEFDDAPAQEAVCAAWGCTCQGMSELYGTAHSKSKFGTATDTAAAWWVANTCSTDPIGNGPAPAPLDPFRIGAALAMLEHPTPESAGEARAHTMRTALATFDPSAALTWPVGGVVGKEWEHRARTLRSALGRYRCPAGGTSSLGQNGGWCLTDQAETKACCDASPPCAKCRWGYFLPWPHTEADGGLAASLAKFFAGQSVIDLGAGVGQYGQYFREHPSSPPVSYRGYDGAENVEAYTKGFLHWVDLSWETDIVPADWVMSFEVGEHIDRQFEGEFIRNLHKLNTKGVVMSWAVPGQGGFHHVNTRSVNFLRHAFATLGYTVDEAMSLKLRESARYYWFKKNLQVYRRS